MEALKVQEGELIEASGVYIMPMEQYHTQCCVGPSISSSGLRAIFHDSPADFWCYSDLNDERFEREPAEHFTFGRAAHALILGEEVFHEKFALRPAHLKDWRTNEAKDWRRAMMRQGKEVLTMDDLKHILYMARALREDPLMPIIMEGYAEYSLIWQDPITSVWLKSRLDMWATTGDRADLKSTSFKTPNKLHRDIYEKGYDMQLALATMGAEVVLGMPFDAQSYEGTASVLCFIYRKPPYHVMPIEVDFDALHWARLKCRAAINTFARCMEQDRWPGPFDGRIETYQAFDAERLGELQAAKMFPATADDPQEDML